MSYRLQKILLAVAGGIFVSTSIGALSASAAEMDVLTLSSFSVSSAGARILGESVTSDEVTQEGWYVAEDGSLYYYYEDGTFAQDVVTLDDGYTYIFASDGALETEWQTVDENRYYYDPDTGVLQFGWISYQNCLYYVDESVGKLVGEQEVDGLRYFFDEYGCVKTGLVTFSDGTVFYYSSDGTMVTGWKTISGKTYYFTSEGALTGMQTVDGNTYYFNSKGVMQTGLQAIGSSTYYFDGSGVMQTGWVTVSGTSYYFDETGAMVSSGYPEIQLEVPNYKQFDEQWANTTITYSTIGKVGCLVTSIAMKYSAETDTETTPDEMLSLLSFSGDNLLWSSYSDLGYTMEQPGTSVTQSVMKTIYDQLASGTPVIVGAKNSSGGQHYVVVTGYTGSTGSTLSTANFLINDPGSSYRTTLSEFLAVYGSLYVLVY